MTFYNIIFGVVFICSVFTFLAALADGSNLIILLPQSILIFLMSFNDIINTSEAVETEKADYNLPLKSLDSINFVLYMFVLFSIKPNNKILNIDFSDFYSSITTNRSKIFWILVFIIFSVSFFWNFLIENKIFLKYNYYVIFFQFLSLFIFVLSVFSVDIKYFTIAFCALYFLFIVMKIACPKFQD
jgi:hypothetical protein